MLISLSYVYLPIVKSAVIIISVSGGRQGRVAPIERVLVPVEALGRTRLRSSVIGMEWIWHGMRCVLLLLLRKKHVRR